MSCRLSCAAVSPSTITVAVPSARSSASVPTPFTSCSLMSPLPELVALSSVAASISTAALPPMPCDEVRLTLLPLTSVESTLSMPAALTWTSPLPASTPFSVSRPLDCSAIVPPLLVAATWAAPALLKSMSPIEAVSVLTLPAWLLAR